MEDTINNRFQRVINEVYAGNKRAFATAAGLSATVIENVVGARQGKPSYDAMHKVCSNANISPAWLLTGEGSMLRSDAPAAATQAPPITAPTADTSPSEAFLKELLKEKDAEIQALNREIGVLEERLNRHANIMSSRFSSSDAPVCDVLRAGVGNPIVNPVAPDMPRPLPPTDQPKNQRDARK